MTTHRFPESPVFYRDLNRTFPVVARGEGIYLFDREGKRYIDAAGGAIVVNVGHGRKEVAQALADQAERVAYAHGSRFTSEPLERLSQKLVGVLPEGLDKVYLVHGGTEAAETAMKLAVQYHQSRGKSGKTRFVGCTPSYHGNTLGALSVSGKAVLRRPYEAILLNALHVPAAYCYRCPYGASHPECGLRCADALGELFDREGAETIAAFFVEPVSGSSAGAAVPPADYLPRIREICDHYDVLLVADEVLTGFGRTGRLFAVEHDGIVPDMLLMGKGLNGGYIPAGAVAVSTAVVERIKKAFSNFTHGYTFSHNPLVAATCLEVLNILEREDLVRHSRDRGEYLLERLRELSRFPFVGDVRGRGLLVGVEFVADKASKKAFPRARKFVEEVVERAFENGLILYPSTGCVDGVDGDLVLVAPPFIVSGEEIDDIVDLFSQTLSQMSS